MNNYCKYKKDDKEKDCIRIKDRHGHFLAKIQGDTLYLFCKRCKNFHALPKEVMLLILKSMNDKD